MFGFGKKKAKGMALLQKKKWEAAQDYMKTATLEEKLEMINYCGEIKARETYDILAPMVRESDEKIQLAAVKAFCVVGDPRAVVHLQWLLSRTPSSNTELVDAIHDAIIVCREGKQI